MRKSFGFSRTKNKKLQKDEKGKDKKLFSSAYLHLPHVQSRKYLLRIRKNCTLMGLTEKNTTFAEFCTYKLCATSFNVLFNLIASLQIITSCGSCPLKPKVKLLKESADRNILKSPHFSAPFCQSAAVQLENYGLSTSAFFGEAEWSSFGLKGGQSQAHLLTPSTLKEKKGRTGPFSVVLITVPQRKKIAFVNRRIPNFFLLLGVPFVKCSRLCSPK